MTNYGYTFRFELDDKELLTFPITPGELTMTVGSNNKVVTLINEGDINILKSPSLAEISFEARFPMRKYPYSRKPEHITDYYDKFVKLKTEKKSFVFVVERTTPSGKLLWGTEVLVALEEFEIKESADEGDDVLITFKLKQFKEYGVKVHKVSPKPITTSTSNKNRKGDNGTSNEQIYTVKSGDCLWNIAKKFYENGTKWNVIYEKNYDIIESTANKYRNGKGSSNGHWIYPGTKLIIPPK